MESTNTRWKGKGFAEIARSNPMSQTLDQLQQALTQQPKTRALLSGQCALLEATPAQADLLNRACLGQPIVTAEKDKQWFELGLEETLYLHHHMKCLPIVCENENPMNDEELWARMKSVTKRFPVLYKAYSHLRSKRWVVRSGSQYGADFVVYRHHPALVHSEYAAIVRSPGCDGTRGGDARLESWPDLQCALRVCGSVAKTLLVLNVECNGCVAEEERFPACLEEYTVEERVIKRWTPEKCRDGSQTVGTNGY
ncbi:tRNA-splicing endonuclease subunit Sen2-1 [Acorus calamus]|uniref:tRNA-intron lyase n=1 Tax=Acorus calamus TaxID=4465 RepID=A0AAV9DSG2_ACOCL|nr:tRNA-splicing endonuclease subunit Sen2-1 [Acorus calamus]